ncbi:glyoxalase [Alphaproteobacteria bacterium 46_93_T64]|nr:glyoxalase [Alphaproteobacteria bacterium 46_93_T64]
MIRLEHINLVVKDIEETLNFIQTAFPDWKVRGTGESEWHGNKRHWLHVGTDDHYISLNEGNNEENRDLSGNSPGLAHIGFCVDNALEISDRLQQNGYEITTIGADHPFRRTVYFIDPSGFEFEFIQYLSNKPSEKNMYGGETSSVKRLHSSQEQKA